MRLTAPCVLLACGATAAESADFAIHLPADPPVPVAFAAQELSRYCEAIFGRTFPQHRVTHLPSSSVLVLARERTALSIPTELLSTGARSGGDGFVVRALPDGIVIAGGSARGTLFGVYTFLERALGCRWYTPDPEDQVVPRHDIGVLKRILARGLDVAEQPDFPFRMREFRDVRPMVDGTDERIVQQIDWWAKLRMNCFLINFGYARDKRVWERWKERLIPEVKRRGLLLGIGEHGSYPLFLNPADYAAEHPDWTCELGGRRIGRMITPGGRQAQFCTTNEAAVKTYLANFVTFARQNPEIDVYYPAPNDNGLWCECETCRRLSVADRYLMLDNRVAEALVGVRADYRTIHLAYANHRSPPETTRPHPNVDIDVACWGRDFAYPLSDPRTMPHRAEYLSVFSDWQKLCKANHSSRLLYHCKFMRHLWLGFQLLPLRVVDEDMPYLRDLGLSGFDLPLGFVGIWTKALNAYVVARKCWDADADSAGIVEEYFRDYYGGHASEARGAYERAAAALSNLRYGSSLSITWRRDLLIPNASSNPEALAYAAQAEQGLAEALALTRVALRQADVEPERSRLRKLETALRQIHQELVLVKALTAAANILAAAEATLGAEARDESQRDELEPLLDAADQAAQQLKAIYRLEDDLDGLLWSGAVHDQFLKAATDWRRQVEDLLSGLVWQQVAEWTTPEFPDKMSIIAKEVDITAHVAVSGPLFVRWKWTHGQLGINIHDVSLWENADGVRRCVSTDKHAGFAGGHDQHTLFKLRLAQLTPGARYVVVGRVQARASYGTVAERGTFGKVLLGARAAPMEQQ